MFISLCTAHEFNNLMFWRAQDSKFIQGWSKNSLNRLDRNPGGKSGKKIPIWNLDPIIIINLLTKFELFHIIENLRNQSADLEKGCSVCLFLDCRSLQNQLSSKGSEQEAAHMRNPRYAVPVTVVLDPTPALSCRGRPWCLVGWFLWHWRTRLVVVSGSIY